MIFICGTNNTIMLTVLKVQIENSSTKSSSEFGFSSTLLSCLLTALPFQEGESLFTLLAGNLT